MSSKVLESLSELRAPTTQAVPSLYTMTPCARRARYTMNDPQTYTEQRLRAGIIMAIVFALTLAGSAGAISLTTSVRGNLPFRDRGASSPNGLRNEFMTRRIDLGTPASDLLMSGLLSLGPPPNHSALSPRTVHIERFSGMTGYPQHVP